MRSSRAVALLLACVLVACGPGREDAPPEGSAGGGAVERADLSEVARHVLEAWERNAEGVSGYTVVESTEGRVDTIRYERVEVDGLSSFRPVGSAEGPERESSPVMMALLREARPTGKGEVEGEETDVLVLEDPATIRKVMGPRGNGTFAPRRIEFHVGREGFPRRMRMQGETEVPADGSVSITTEVTLTDWREVEGFAHPFRRTTRVEGMAALAAAAREGAMAQMERRLEGMPESQKETAREALRRRLDAMAAQDGRERVTVTRSLEVERE